MRLVSGVVTGVVSEPEGIQYVRVALDGGETLPEPAVCYVALTGRCRVDERVVVNTTGVDLGLGTGALHFIVARVGGHGRESLDSPSGGHVMKLRYTPLQIDVLAVEEEESPHHDVMRSARSLEGMPVVCCGLHSQLPHAAAAVKRALGSSRVAYVMTDQAALPIALSDLVRACRAAGLVDAIVTCGQAFGGELEAVNLHSGLLAARHAAGADVAVVAIGPGVAGTATPLGHGGVAQGEAVNAAACLGGEPVAALRLSFADERPRHRPVSHHTLTALSTVALAPARVALPTLPAAAAAEVERVLEDAGVWVRHRLERAGVTPEDLPDTRGVEVRTMGRPVAEDPAFFAAAAAAGEVAARLAAD